MQPLTKLLQRAYIKCESLSVLSYNFKLFPRSWAGREVDKVALQAFIGTLNERIDVYDKILAKQKYAAGDVSFAFLSNRKPSTRYRNWRWSIFSIYPAYTCSKRGSVGIISVRNRMFPGIMALHFSYFIFFTDALRKMVGWDYFQANMACCQRWPYPWP